MEKFYILKIKYCSGNKTVMIFDNEVEADRQIDFTYENYDNIMMVEKFEVEAESPAQALELI